MDRSSPWRRVLASTASKLSYHSNSLKQKQPPQHRRHHPQQHRSHHQQQTNNIYSSSASQLQNLSSPTTNYSHVVAPFLANDNFSVAKPANSNPHGLPSHMLSMGIRPADNAPSSHPAVDYNTSPPPRQAPYAASAIYEDKAKRKRVHKSSISSTSSSSMSESFVLSHPMPNASILPQKPDRKKRAWFSRSFSSCLEDGFDKFGQLIGAYPLATMLFAVSLASAGAFGLIGFTVDNNPDRMWSLTNSDFLSTKKFVDEQFPETVQKFTIIAAVPEGESILTPLALRRLLELDDDVHALPGMDAQCYKIRGECVVLGVLDRLRYPQFAGSSDVLSVLNAKEKLKYFVPSSLPYASIPDRLEPTEYLGGIVRNVSDPQRIANARAIKLIYLMKKPVSMSVYANGERETRSLNEWKSAFKQLAESGRQKFRPPITNIYVSNDARWDGGNNQQTAPYFMTPANWPQLQTILASVGLVSVLLLVLTSRCSRIGHAFWLSICVWAVVILIVVFAVGIASAIGLASSALHHTLILVVLIMLTPNMYVLCTEVAELPLYNKKPKLSPSPTEAGQSLSDSTGLLMRLSAVAITTNTVYFLVAFVVLAFSKVAVIRSIAIYGIILDISTFIFTLLFFAPAVAIRLSYIVHYRDACFPCISYVDDTTIEPNATPFPKAYGLDRLCRRFSRLLSKIYAVAAVKLLLFLTLLTLLVLSIYWLAHDGIRFDTFRPLDYTDYITSTSEYQRAEYELFPHSNETTEINSNIVAIYFTKNFNYVNKRTQLDLLHQYLHKSDVFNSIEPESVASWYERFKVWLTDGRNNHSTMNFFYPTNNNAMSRLMYEFLGHNHFHSDVKLRFDRGELPKVDATRIWFRLSQPLYGQAPQGDQNAFKLKALTNFQTVLDGLQLSSADGVHLYSPAMPLLFIQQYMTISFWPMLAIFLVIVAVFGWLLVQRLLAGLILIVFICSTLLLTLGVAAKVDVVFDAFASVHLFVALTLDCVCATWFIYVFLARSDGRASSATESRKQQRLKLAFDGCAVLYVASACTAVGVFALLASFTSTSALRSLLIIYAITIGSGFVVSLLWLPSSVLLTSRLQPLSHAITILRNNQLDYVSQIPRLFLRPPNIYEDHGGGGDSSHLSVNTQSTEGANNNNALVRNSSQRQSRHDLIDFDRNITKHQTQPYFKQQQQQQQQQKLASVFKLRKPTDTERDGGAENMVVNHNMLNHNSSSRPISRSYQALQRNLEHLSRSTSDDMSINGPIEYVIDVLTEIDEENRSGSGAGSKPYPFKKYQKRGVSPAAVSGSNVSAISARYVGREFQNQNNKCMPDYSAWRGEQRVHRVSTQYTDEHQRSSISNVQHQPYRRSNTGASGPSKPSSAQPANARLGTAERAALESFHYHAADVTGMASKQTNVYASQVPAFRPPPIPSTLPTTILTPSAYNLQQQQQSPVHRKLNNRIQKFAQHRMSTLYESVDRNNCLHAASSVVAGNANFSLQTQPSGIFSYTAQEERQAREAFKDGINTDNTSPAAAARGIFEIPHLRHVVPATPSAAAAASRATNQTAAKKLSVKQQQQFNTTAVNKPTNQPSSLQSELQTKLTRRKQTIEAATIFADSRPAEQATATATADIIWPDVLLPRENSGVSVPVENVVTKLTAIPETDEEEAKRSAIALRIQEARAKFAMACSSGLA